MDPTRPDPTDVLQFQLNGRTNCSEPPRDGSRTKCKLYLYATTSAAAALHTAQPYSQPLNGAENSGRRASAADADTLIQLHTGLSWPMGHPSSVQNDFRYRPTECNTISTTTNLTQYDLNTLQRHTLMITSRIACIHLTQKKNVVRCFRVCRIW